MPACSPGCGAGGVLSAPSWGVCPISSGTIVDMGALVTEGVTCLWPHSWEAVCVCVCVCIFERQSALKHGVGGGQREETGSEAGLF